MCLEEDEMFGCCFLGEGGGGALPSSLEARNWANSLDKLLLSSYGTALFRAFLQKEYAEENLDFVLKVERYRQAEGCDRDEKLAVLWIRIRKDPHHFGNLDPDQLKIRIRIKELSWIRTGSGSSSICRWLAKLYGIKHFFKVMSLNLEDRIWIRIRIK